MKGTQAALALGVGYLLGRRKKLRLATVLAVGAAAGGMGGMSKLGPAALRQGSKYLARTDLADALGPQVGEIVNTIRGDLLDAGRAAATSAVTSRLDSFTDNLHQRAESLRNPEAAAGEAGETVGRTAGRAGQTAGRAGGGLRSLRRRGGGADEGGDGEDRESEESRRADDEDLADYEDGEEPDESRGNGRNRRSRTRRREDTRAEADEGDDERDEIDEPRDEADEPDETDEPDDEYDDEGREDQGEDEPLDDEAPEDEAGEPEDEAGEPDDEDAEEPAPRRRRASRSPVVRTRR